MRSGLDNPEFPLYRAESRPTSRICRLVLSDSDGSLGLFLLILLLPPLLGVFFRSETEVAKLIFGVLVFPYLFLRYFESRFLRFVFLIEISL